MILPRDEITSQTFQREQLLIFSSRLIPFPALTSTMIKFKNDREKGRGRYSKKLRRNPENRCIRCVWYYISSKLVASRSNNGTFGHRRAFSLPLNASFPFGWKPPCRLRLYPVVIIPRNIQARIVHPGWPRLALLTPAREYTAFKSSDFKDLPPSCTLVKRGWRISFASPWKF